MEIFLLFINPTVLFRTFTAQFYFSNVKKYLNLVQDTVTLVLLCKIVLIRVIFYYNFILNILLRCYKYVSPVKSRANSNVTNIEIRKSRNRIKTNSHMEWITIWTSINYWKYHRRRISLKFYSNMIWKHFMLYIYYEKFQRTDVIYSYNNSWIVNYYVFTQAEKYSVDFIDQ